MIATIGSMKLFLLALTMQNGIAVGMVGFQDGNGPVQTIEYRIEGCAELGNRYITRDGMTTKWEFKGSRVADRIATAVCGQIEDSQKWM